MFIAIKASLSETDKPDVRFNLLISKVIFPGLSAKSASQIELCFIEFEIIEFSLSDFLVSSKFSGSTEYILAFLNFSFIAVLIPAIRPPPPQQHKTMSGITFNFI